MLNGWHVILGIIVLAVGVGVLVSFVDRKPARYVGRSTKRSSIKTADTFPVIFWDSPDSSECHGNDSCDYSND